MKTYAGGEHVRNGTYLNLMTGEFLSFQGNGKESLPNRHPSHYVRVPIGLVFILGPLMGLAYFLFLPFAGFVSIAVLAVHRLRALAAVMVPRQAKR